MSRNGGLARVNSRRLQMEFCVFPIPSKKKYSKFFKFIFRILFGFNGLLKFFEMH